MRLSIGLLVLALAATAVRADDIKPEQCIIGTIRVQPMMKGALVKQIRAAFGEAEYGKFIAEGTKELGFSPEDIVGVTIVMPLALGAPGNEPPFVLVEVPKAEYGKTLAEKQKMTVLHAAGSIAGKPNCVVYQSSDGTNYTAMDGTSLIVMKSTLVGKNPDDAATIIRMMSTAHADLQKKAADQKAHALTTFGKGVFDMANALPLPPQADAFKPILKASGASLALTLDDTLTIDLRGSYANAEDANAAKEVAEQLITLGGLGINMLKAEQKKNPADAKEITMMTDMLTTLQKGAKPKVEGTSLIVRTEAKLPEGFAKLMVDAVQKVRGSAARMQSQNNLKQIALAVHNYTDLYGRLPSNICDKDGKPLLSWRVQLLPYLEQDNLYKQFKLDESWDSEHNKKLMMVLPKVYAHPNAGKETAAGFTHYRTFAPKPNSKVVCFFPFDSNERRSFTSITDGLSNTLMVVEAADAVAWTKPDSLLFDPDGKLPRLGGLFPGGFNVAIGDGSVRFMKDTVKEATLKAMITANGGEVFTDPDH